MITASTLAKISGRIENSNMRSIVAGLEHGGTETGLDKPHRVAHYLCQLGHESNGYKYDREIWGPTAAQSRYDIRTDLGNSPQRDGDGFKYRGRTVGQITGKSNYRQFTGWCRKMIDPAAPDFVEDPDSILTDPWEGLAPIWYWTTRNLNRYADTNNIEMVTRRINGGLNGYADRLIWYDRAALTLLGRDPRGITSFQRDAEIEVDGISGPVTRGAMHRQLKTLPSFTKPAPAAFVQIPRPDALQAYETFKTALEA